MVQPIPDWDHLSRDRKVSLLVRGLEYPRRCPVCDRVVAVVRGYFSQHSAPDSWPKGRAIRQCESELTWIGDYGRAP